MQRLWNDISPGEQATRTGRQCTACGGELYQRDDDTEETVRRRLEVYRLQTEPLIRYYERRGLLRTVSGDQDIDSVNRDTLTELGRA